jgi:alpha-galactosidase
MKLARLNFGLLLILASLPAWLAIGARGQSAPTQSNLIHGGNLAVEVFDDGSYALRSTAIPGDVLRTEVEADTVKGTFKSSLYPRHLKSIAAFDDELGSGHLLTVTHTGLPGTPDLVCEFRVYDDQPWGDIRVSISNTTGSPIEMHQIRVIKIGKGDIVQLNGPASADRVLSDDYSESPVQLMNLGEPKNGIHLGFQSQLIYNQKSGQSLFLGALS